MTLIDAGPMFALVDAAQLVARRETRSILSRLPGGVLTTLPAFSEAMHLCGRAGGFPMQQALQRLWHNKRIRFIPLEDPHLRRASVLMEKYRDRPMDFADATLVSAAEFTGIRRVITLDSDFYIYRFLDREAFDVINPLA